MTKWITNILNSQWFKFTTLAIMNNRLHTLPNKKTTDGKSMNRKLPIVSKYITNLKYDRDQCKMEMLTCIDRKTSENMMERWKQCTKLSSFVAIFTTQHPPGKIAFRLRQNQYTKLTCVSTFLYAFGIRIILMTIFVHQKHW